MGKNEAWENSLPDETLDIYEPYLELFFKTMYERQQVWYKRFILRQEAPWTDDKYLRDYKFTNVYRELDRTSQWLINNIIKPHNTSGESEIELVWKIMFFKYFNNPATFEYIKEKRGYFIPNRKEYDVEQFSNDITAFRETGCNPYTNAYLINSQACPGQSRDWCYTRKVIPTLHKEMNNIYVIIKKAKEPEEIIKKITSLPAAANFIAHEFYQDFCYVERYTGKALMKFNADDYTNIGPGANVGIRLIFPNRKTTAEKIQAIHDLKNLSYTYLKQFGKFKYLNWTSEIGYYVTPGHGDLSLHQIEMYLCEFQKYVKMMVGEGKQRSKFTPRTVI